MRHPVAGVDHVYLLVGDLGRAAGQYRRLGFTLSPRGLHSAEKGTANHTIMFGRDYLELMGVVAEVPGNLDRRTRLAEQGEGLQAVVGRIGDAAGARAALAGLGIPAGPVSAFSRPVPLPGGAEGLASFETVDIAPEAVPQGVAFLCRHLTPDLVWQPALQAHTNGATGLAGVTGIAADPRTAAEGFARLFAAGAVEPAEGGFRVTTGAESAPLLFVSGAAAAALYPGLDLAATPSGGFAALRIRVASPDRARQVLESAGLSPAATPGGGIAVGPGDCAGAVIEFVPEG